MPYPTNDAVDIPEIPCPLSEDEMATLHELFNPLAPSDCFGMDIYIALAAYVNNVTL